MVGIFIDHDLIAVPEPVGTQGQVEGCNAESPAVKPESTGTASANAPDVAASEAAGEVPVLPGMIEVEPRVVPSRVMPDPGAVVMDMWGLGMALVIVKIGRRVGNCSTRGGWTMLRNESATDCVTASMAAMLRQGGQREDQGYSQQRQGNGKMFWE